MQLLLLSRSIFHSYFFTNANLSFSINVSLDNFIFFSMMGLSAYILKCMCEESFLQHFSRNCSRATAFLVQWYRAVLMSVIIKVTWSKSWTDFKTCRVWKLLPNKTYLINIEFIVNKTSISVWVVSEVQFQF